MKNVLIVDVDPEKLKNISKAIKKKTGFCCIFTAQDGLEAVDIIEHNRLDLVITNIEIPGVDGFEILTYLSKHYPHVKVIVMTSSKSQLMAGHIQQLGGTLYADAPTDMEGLNTIIFAELQIDLGGKVHGISLPSFLQMMELEGKSCKLLVTSGNKNGILYFFNGNLIAATYEAITGKEAALHILGWDQITIEIDYSAFHVKNKISGSLMSLLLESRRRLDESRSIGTQKRSHERYKCLISVDYDMGDWSYRSCIKNISLGGAYIEMNHPVKVGEEIVLTLTSPPPVRTCHITAAVVRRDKNGVGVKFSELSLLQKEMIDMIIHKE